MTRYKKLVTQHVDIDINERELITISEAAKLLNITTQGVAACLYRGIYTIIIDTHASNPQKGRRLLLRSEVLASTRS